MQKPIKTDIDTTNQDKKLIFNNVIQGDTLKLTINVYQGSASLDLTGQNIHIIVKRSSGTSVEMVTGNTFLSSSGNTIIAIFKDEYCITDTIGDTTGEIVLIDANGESSTNHFIFTVEESLSNNIIPKMSDKLDTLLGIEETIANYNQNAGYLSEQNALAIQNKAELTALNSTSDTLADRLETDITNGTSAAERLETDIATGDVLDTTLKADIATGNTLHNNLSISISNGNNVIAELQNVNWEKIQSFMDLMDTMLNGIPLIDENSNRLTDENGNYLTM